MSEKAKLIKTWYQEGRWTLQRVFNVVGKPSGITPEEYQEITGQVYPVKE